MPIRVLERLKGPPYKQRKGFLRGGGIDFCVLVTFFGLALECALLGGELLFAWVMADLFQLSASLWYPEFIMLVEPFMFAAYCLNLFLAESVYVCMGFGLYINGRVETEGWDIQLLFKNFTESPARTSPARRRGGLRAGVFLVLAFAALFPDFLGAEETGPSSGPVPFEALKEVLESRDFGSYEDTWGIRRRSGDEEEDLPRGRGLPSPSGLREALGQGLRAVLVVGIAGAAAYCLVLFLRRRKGWGGGAEKGRGRSLGNPCQNDPASLLEEAIVLHAGGKLREAWAACFASAIASYVRFRGLSFPPRATEYACLGIVRLDAGGAGDFAFLVEIWVCLAYAGREPDGEAFARAVRFCRSLAGECRA
jgi:hypothetical protein